MITINVQYFNILVAYAGARKQSFELPDGTTFSDLLLHVSRTNPPAFQDVLLQDGVPSPHLRLFRNGSLVDQDSMNTFLMNGDEIMLFPAVAGGDEDVLELNGERKRIRRGIFRGRRGDENGCISKK